MPKHGEVMDVFNVKRKVGKYKDSLRDKNTTQTGLSNRGNILAHITEKSGGGCVSWAEA